MNSQEHRAEYLWIALILRIAVSTMFGAAAIEKFLGGHEGTSMYFHELFAETWLPMQFVETQAAIIPWVEMAITVWLLFGFRIMAGWIVTGFFTISLAFGTMVAGSFAEAANNYFLVFLCCMGLFFSQFDYFSIDGWLKRKA